MDDVAAVVVAAGHGERMGGPVRKQYLPLAGRPVLAQTLAALWQPGLLGGIVLVTAAGDEDYCRNEIIERWGLAGVRAVVAGGRRRQDSVTAGLAVLPGDTRWVVVHDGVRPFVSGELLRRVLEAARGFGAAVPGFCPVDTVKVVDGEGFVQSTPDRRALRAVQTPQVFRRDWLEEAHRRAAAEDWEASDDAGLLERCGYPVRVVEGERWNIKLTTPEDLALAEALLERRRGCAGGLRV